MAEGSSPNFISRQPMKPPEAPHTPAEALARAQQGVERSRMQRELDETHARELREAKASRQGPPAAHSPTEPFTNEPPAAATRRSTLINPSEAREELADMGGVSESIESHHRVVNVEEAIQSAFEEPAQEAVHPTPSETDRPDYFEPTDEEYQEALGYEPNKYIFRVDGEEYFADKSGAINHVGPDGEVTVVPQGEAEELERLGVEIFNKRDELMPGWEDQAVNPNEIQGVVEGIQVFGNQVGIVSSDGEFVGTPIEGATPSETEFSGVHVGTGASPDISEATAVDTTGVVNVGRASAPDLRVRIPPLFPRVREALGRKMFEGRWAAKLILNENFPGKTRVVGREELTPDIGGYGGADAYKLKQPNGQFNHVEIVYDLRGGLGENFLGKTAERMKVQGDAYKAEIQRISGLLDKARQLPLMRIFRPSEYNRLVKESGPWLKRELKESREITLITYSSDEAMAGSTGMETLSSDAREGLAKVREKRRRNEKKVKIYEELSDAERAQMEIPTEDELNAMDPEEARMTREALADESNQPEIILLINQKIAELREAPTNEAKGIVHGDLATLADKRFGVLRKQVKLTVAGEMNLVKIHDVSARENVYSVYDEKNIVEVATREFGRHRLKVKHEGITATELALEITKRPDFSWEQVRYTPEFVADVYEDLVRQRLERSRTGLTVVIAPRSSAEEFRVKAQYDRKQRWREEDRRRKAWGEEHTVLRKFPFAARIAGAGRLPKT